VLFRSAKTYVIDDAELARVKNGYPIMWKNADATPSLCFVGCPHLSLKQLHDWTQALSSALLKAGRTKVAVPTVFTTPVAVQKEFEKTPDYQTLTKMGVIVSYICPLMYMNNPLCGKMPVVTNSNKLRTYTTARYHTDAEILAMLAKEGN
jgi:predicted aconitase